MDLLSVAMEELHKLREPIPPAELNRTKNIAKMNILISLERQGDRCEELGRAFQTFGDVEINKYVEKISNVTGEQINRAAIKLLKGKPSLVVMGDRVNQIPGGDLISKALN